jgi:hypothetical protein
LRIRRLSPDDAPAVAALAVERGWRPHAGAWSIALSRGSGFGAEAAEGGLAGAAILLPHGGRVAVLSVLAIDEVAFGALRRPLIEALFPMAVRACLAVAGGRTVGCGLAWADDAQFQLGARLGYSIPSGEAYKGAKISDLTTGQIPITLELGFRSGNFSPGLFLDIAPGILNKDISGPCEAAGDTCLTLGLRFGVQGNFAFAPAEPVSPWIGGRIAIESLAYAESVAGTTASLGFGGWGFGLQGGVDFNSGALAIGPYVALDFARYSTMTVDDGSGSTSSVDIPSSERTWHSWLTFGAKLGITF